MTDLGVRCGSVPGADGLLGAITRESAGWSYVGFDVYRLARGASLERTTEQREVCAVLLSGRADVSFGAHEWEGVGSRPSVFDGAPDAVYAPPGGALTVTASTAPSEAPWCWPPAERAAQPAPVPGPA